MTCFPYQIIMNRIKNIEKKAGGVLLNIRISWIEIGQTYKWHKISLRIYS